jgi:uncharacterized membrane protein
MTDDGGYDLQPAAPRRAPDEGGPSAADDAAGAARLKPGDPGWTPPVPIIEEAEPGDEPQTDPDVEQSKVVAALAYLWFFLPLIAAPKSNFARFHANQGLLALLTGIAVTWMVATIEVSRWLIARFVPIDLLRVFFSCGFYLLEVALLVGWVALLIKGMMTAMDGEKKELPIVGHWKLIK